MRWVNGDQYTLREDFFLREKLTLLGKGAKKEKGPPLPCRRLVLRNKKVNQRDAWDDQKT